MFIQNIAKTSDTDDATVVTIMCWFILMDCIVSILLFTGCMSSTYSLSKKVIGAVRKQTCSFNKWERRFYASCRPFEFAIAQGKFVDGLTPLVLLDNMLSFSVNLLLLDR